jgi:hypothetical protein
MNFNLLQMSCIADIPRDGPRRVNVAVRCFYDRAEVAILMKAWTAGEVSAA